MIDRQLTTRSCPDAASVRVLYESCTGAVGVRPRARRPHWSHGESTVGASAIPAAQPSRFEIKEEGTEMIRKQRRLCWRWGLWVPPACMRMISAMSVTFWRDSTVASASSRRERGRAGEPGWNVAERQAEHRERRSSWRRALEDRRSQGRHRHRGRIRVRGRGLLLASSNSIGQNANQSVFATLICEAAAPFVEHSTTVAFRSNRTAIFESTTSWIPSRRTAPAPCC